jgi:hypothetical protein
MHECLNTAEGEELRAEGKRSRVPSLGLSLFDPSGVFGISNLKRFFLFSRLPVFTILIFYKPPP